MAGFHTKTFTVHDDYMTPKYAWENIQHLIPKDKKIWEAFYGDGKSGSYLKELGFDEVEEVFEDFMAALERLKNLQSLIPWPQASQTPEQNLAHPTD